MKHLCRMISALLLLAAGLLAGCSTHSTVGVETPNSAAQDRGVPVSPFLGDTSDLHPDPEQDLLGVYSKRTGILADYEAFLVEPVLVFFDPEANGGGVNPEELVELADHLRTQGIEELQDGGFKLVEKPGPGVARVRVAITGVKPVRPSRNLGTKAAGVAVGIGLLVPSVDVGSASIEAEILDAETGERLVAVIATSEGRRFFNLKNSSTRWGDTKAAFKKWAKQFRQRLEKARDAREAGR